MPAVRCRLWWWWWRRRRGLASRGVVGRRSLARRRAYPPPRRRLRDRCRTGRRRSARTPARNGTPHGLVLVSRAPLAARRRVAALDLRSRRPSPAALAPPVRPDAGDFRAVAREGRGRRALRTGPTPHRSPGARILVCAETAQHQAHRGQHRGEGHDGCHPPQTPPALATARPGELPPALNADPGPKHASPQGLAGVPKEPRDAVHGGRGSRTNRESLPADPLPERRCSPPHGTQVPRDARFQAGWMVSGRPPKPGRSGAFSTSG
jgi:hypothetical protein